MFQPDGPVIKRTPAKKTFRAYFEIHPARRNFNFLECINFVGRTAASSGTNCREACIKDPARSSIKIFSELVVDRKRERKKKELWDVTRTDLHLAWISLHAAYAFPGFVSRDSILPDGFECLILRDIRQESPDWQVNMNFYGNIVDWWCRYRQRRRKRGIFNYPVLYDNNKFEFVKISFQKHRTEGVEVVEVHDIETILLLSHHYHWNDLTR